MTNNFKWDTDSWLNRDYNWDPTVAETKIITVPGNKKSELKAERALNSCMRIGQPNVEIYHGYDGTNKKTIHTPAHLKNSEMMSWVKVLDPALSITEVACALSHISLWIHCININKPIVILEHDAIMIRQFRTMSQTNSVEYLGSVDDVTALINKLGFTEYSELVQHYLDPVNYLPVKHHLPMTSVINYNYLYSMGLHAYAIDPFIARRLFARVLTDGLINPVDCIVEVTDFELVQTGVYAFQSQTDQNDTIIGFTEAGKMMHGRKNTYSVPGVSQ